MSDNKQRYYTIQKALLQLYGQPSGNRARQVNVLAALVSGIVGSKRTNLPAVAGAAPSTAKRESRVKQFKRWVAHQQMDAELYFLPVAQTLLANLAHRPLVLLLDGSEVGRHCLTLMFSVVYRGRALPLAWVVIRGSKGHFPAETHVALLEQVQALVPPEATVILLGDGEFDTVALQAAVNGYGWQYVCRTAANIILGAEGEEFTVAELGLRPGQRVVLSPVTFTRQHYGPVLVVAWWKRGYQEPLYLVSNMELAEEACHWYARRFHIETFFSDQKSRGFHLHKSHLADPERLARLMIAACLAYLWIVYLGALAVQDGWNKIIHRTDRCDLSLFQLGLRLLDHFQNEDLPIPVAFWMLEQEVL